MINLITKMKRVAWFDDRFYELQFVDGRTEYYPSSTTILGLFPNDGITRWRGDVGNREADRRMHDAADRGSRVHNAINIWLLGGAVLYEPNRYEDPELRAQNAMIIAQCEQHGYSYTVLHEQAEMVQVQRFVEWFSALNGRAEVDAAEYIVYNHEHRFAGTLDIHLFFRSGGNFRLYNQTDYELCVGRYVVDIKTGHMDPKYHLQTASYAGALEMLIGQEITGTIIVNLDADPSNERFGAKTFLRTHDQWKADYQDFLTMRKVYDMVNTDTQPKAGSFPVVLMREVNGEILTGTAPDRTVADAQVGAINKVAEKEPVPVPVPEGSGEPLPGAELEQALTPSSEPNNGNGHVKGELLAKVKGLVLSVYPDPVKNKNHMTGAGNLMRRAFVDEQGNPLIQTFREAINLTEGQIQNGLPQLEADVQLILSNKKGAK